MALDGSFCVESALEKFLARCPNLRCVPQFVTMIEKEGHMVTEEEVASLVAELFVHPNYTLPLLGCFRPIAQMIVGKTVSLLRFAKFNPPLPLAVKEEDGDDVNIIKFHVNRGWNLNLHELVCRAFSRALDLAPFLLEHVLAYFEFAPPPFERIQKQVSYSELSAKDVTELLDVARTSYRLLLMEPEVFSKLSWDWSCFLHFEQKPSNLDLGKTKNDEFGKQLLDIRWCWIQIRSVICKIGDKITTNLGVGDEEALTCFLRWKEYCQDVSLEKAGWYMESCERKKLDSNGTIDLYHDKCLESLGHNSLAIASSQFLEFQPSTKTRRLESWNAPLPVDPFVFTSTVKKSFEMVLLAVSQKLPVLLYGPAGGGKTALISKLAQTSGNKVLSIYMDDQIDSNTLIGSYVCTEHPGEFRWQPGSLTQAALKGFWVVFEDIDKAPTDVLSILLPLLEGASSFATGHGEVIRVAKGFRLFSTISSSKLDVSCSTEGGVLWRRVMVRPPNTEDLKNIVNEWYPCLQDYAEKLIETFETVNTACLHNCSFSSLSRFSLRDLLKWCRRIASFLEDDLSAHRIYQEAVDIFAAFSTSIENRLAIMKEIAKMWAVPASVAETLYPLNKPIIQDLPSELRIGRISFHRTRATLRSRKKPFAGIRSSLHVLERIACSVKFKEPVLLVGETGTGKTTLVQNLALRLDRKLTVLNLSQQSDIADLLGGFKPMDAQFVCVPLYKEFEVLFSKTFSVKGNNEFLARLQGHLSNKNWKRLLRGFGDAVNSYEKSVKAGRSDSGKKRKKLLDEDVHKAWKNFTEKLDAAHGQIGASSGMLFSFVEGAFVTALRNGEWILLDEVNLAPPETLQRIIGVLEGEYGSFCLTERGDADYIDRHPDFQIFACMNPATDAGKRDLPYSLRSRFTEYFVDDVLNDDDLTLFINQFDEFLDDSNSNRELVKKIVCFYKEAKKNSDERLQDGANQKPQYSLRSLYRALQYTQKARRKFRFQKAIYDGFSMFFLALLDRSSAKIMSQMILSYLLEGKAPPHVPFDDYLVGSGTSRSHDFLESYVLTKSVKEHLSSLARAIFIKSYPVLLQGPTSSGKTSLVQYLAALTGHEFVRINNHEHTDLQEYLGFYITDKFGKLVFHEGVLVKAVRNGYWIVLDELNLAPSDVLEALNRLLDDNRELFVPELRETVQAHPDFMLFATQNPPTLYGGRKMLSRAFRNRFVEIHVEEIPENELSTILEKRCKIPESYALKMVEVMKELQLQRQSSKVFAGKHGFITPRDLFRWANRYSRFGNSDGDLARDGYYLLAGRLRNESEKSVVQEVLEKHLRVKFEKLGLYEQVETEKSVKEVLEKHDLYEQESGGRNSEFNFRTSSGVSESLRNIAFTPSMLRLLFLVGRCFELREPVLLVGETGGGKTTVCQLLSIIKGFKLHILNCHQYTESSDFLGGFHPIRDRSRIASEYTCLVEQLKLMKDFFPREVTISLDIGRASSTLEQLDVIINNYRQGHISCPKVTAEDLDTFVQMRLELGQLHQKWQTIFMWQDGPLVQAMKNGDLFLVDEISLADDSVLERLNSVLEPERKLSLVEKGGSDLESITAHPNFFLLATMNPGGDFGKKELSPALRNRFTEIWVHAVDDLSELKEIALQRLPAPKFSCIVEHMLTFWKWFNQLQIGSMLTVRDLLSWVAFINVTEKILEPEPALLHGAFLVLLDGLSLGTGISKNEAGELREKCLSFLLGKEVLNSTNDELSRMKNYGWGDLEVTVDVSCNEMDLDNLFGIYPFFIEKGDVSPEDGEFDLLAPTTRRNALRVLRAMQLAKPVLLEGSPGVGKTSLIVALGKFSGHRVVRINLSEQTEIMDLLGSDLPVDSDEGMKFAWSDGILLQALKEGCWVLLDELNLAPQSVLEGLNAILDHRAEVFIPELGRTFSCPSSFRVFACQNPSSQGGGRKGLPKSFLNRFTKVYVDELVDADYLSISSSRFPSIPEHLLTKLIIFNKRLHEETMLYHKFAHDGSPWEFNLRDVVRSCQIIQGAPEKFKSDCFLNIVYLQRMRTAADRREVLQLYEQVFEVKPFMNPYPRVQINPKSLIVGNTTIMRNNFLSSKVFSSQLKILPGICHSLEAVAQCVQQQWLCILIGPSSSGKTSLIRLLAQLTGNVLNELNLSTATDISELLGCFEQYNALRHFRSVVAEVEHYVNEVCGLQMDIETLINARKMLVRRWSTLLSNTSCGDLTGSASTFSEIIELLRFFLVHIEPMKSDMKTNLSWSEKDLSRIQKTTIKLQENFQRRSFSAKFEWVTGLLIKAIENGEWIVLENANLCNPTVLDRINSLVEPCGSITVNECGIVDGKPVVIYPHSNFRMFLTVNPTYGEVSRAMRNRGVEIFLMQPYWVHNGESGYSQEETEFKDLKRFLVLSGIPFAWLVDAMAKAHVYAKNEGLRLNVDITYLELARWVQLFQQLIVNGNQPMWSLQISWEHTYLSSLGEAEGGSIIAHAKISYFPINELFISSLGSVLCLPGGWPMSITLGDMVLYSKEASLRQNVMYLEFLMKMLHRIMLPDSTNEMISCFGMGPEFNLALAKKMLLFAFNWTIEQATESDIDLYLCWISWFMQSVQPVQSFSEFIGSLLTLLKQELKHPIWIYIRRYHQELLACPGISWAKCQNTALIEEKREGDLDVQPIPMLSLELVIMTASNDKYISTSKLLHNAIKCVGVLRLSYQQWNAERGYHHSEKTECSVPFLSSLQMLEEKVLRVLVESPSFDMLIQLFTALLEDHISFWHSLTSSDFEYLQFFLRSLIKDVKKLQEFCPIADESEKLLMQSRNLVSSRSEKSMLWVHGGHPFLPPSSDLCDKQHKLLVLCDLIWPRKTKSSKMADNRLRLLASNPQLRLLASNPQLRLLAMEGVCMSSYIMGKCDEDNNTHVVLQLEEMSQMLLKRAEYEIKELEAIAHSSEHAMLVGKSAACCIFCSEVLCWKCGFDSWQETLPIADSSSCNFDMNLLQELSMIVLLDAEEQQEALSRVTSLLKTALDFSLNFSTRPPTNFVAYQEILWTLDAWSSVDAAHSKLAGYVLEMWFRWHYSLWNFLPAFVKNMSKIDDNDNDIPLPDMLAQPIKTATIVQILKGGYAIKDYLVHLLKLRSASCNLWQSYASRTTIPNFLLSGARSLFQQIIYSHKKSLDAQKYSTIKSLLCSFEKNVVTDSNIQLVSSLISSASHRKLTSLMDDFIKPLLRELYLHSPTSDFLKNIGCAWLRIGGLRFHLLLCDDLDPALKYSCKYSQLVEKISLLELETKVRQECGYLAGWSSTREADNGRVQTLNNLEVERKNLQRKIVFRSDPGRFKNLKGEFYEFLNHIESAMGLINVMDVQQMSDKMHNWQERATAFIERLSDEYPSYIDIIQPVQVAVYEIKLGLSLILSNAFQKEILSKVEQQNMDLVLETIYSFMRFPRGCAFKSISVNVKSRQPKFPSYSVDFPTDLWALDMPLLEKLVIITRDSNADNTVSQLQLKAVVYQNILVRVAHFVANAKLLDNASFVLLEDIFGQFVDLWMNMKEQAKNKEDHEAQQFKFRPRVFKIERVFEFDVSTLGVLSQNESFLEWQELLSEEEFNVKKEAGEEDDTLVEEWNLMEECILKKVVHTYIQLFGPVDLSINAGNTHVSDADRLISFKESYSLGVGMIKGLEGFSSSSLDAKLVPEHLLRLSLKHEQKFVLPHKSINIYNFYKDSNAPEMAKMVELLTTLQKRVSVLLKEWEDHPGLKKILEVIEMLLVIPLSTPLAKALSGLRFLINRAQTLQENVSRFSLSGQLEPILVLASSWKKMECDSWPALLDEVQGQYDINAGRLWFPLYSVLQHRQSTDIEEYKRLTIQSLKEFIQTSSVGEFRRRLHLLYAFHGQINMGICMGSYLSPHQMENMKILYNVFGYYMQFLPAILEHIEANRKLIEKEIKELLKLCRWERPESYLSMDNSKRTQQKLKKLIQKYNDLLQQSVMLIIGQEAARRGIQFHSLQNIKLPNKLSDKNEGMPSPAFDMTQFSENRCLWYAHWRKELEISSQNLLGTSMPDFSFSCLENVYQGEWKVVWCTLEKVCRHSGELWEDLNKSQAQWSYSEILKLLKESGLSMHKSMFPEDQHKFHESSEWLLQQPSFDMQHLLMTQSKASHQDVNVIASRTLPSLPDEDLDTEWRLANQYYFRSMASVQHMHQICLNFHKDFYLEQVKRSGFFLDHLMVIQLEQRQAAYSFAEKLRSLKKCVASLEQLYLNSTATDDRTSSVTSAVHNQHATFKCMWQQKQLFDSLCSMLHEEYLLLRTVESSHLKGCKSVKAEANGILAFLEKVIQVCQKPKESLDCYLLGHDRLVIGLDPSLHPYVISREMDQLVLQNFQALREFEDQFCAFRTQDVDKRSVKDTLLRHFEDILMKGKLIKEEFYSSLKTSGLTIQSEEAKCCNGSYPELEGGVLKSSLKHILNRFQAINERPPNISPWKNISSWKNILESYVTNVQLDKIHDELLKIIFSAEKMVDCSANENHTSLVFLEGAHLKNLHQLSDLVLKFGDGLLHDFLSMHKMVSLMTLELANLFVSLYSKGYGTSAENQGDNTDCDTSQDASGTGMGEGEGKNDVSDQITDEDQLLGTQKEDQDTSNEVPGKNDKGIEMDEDFDADACSVSEDSGDDNNDEGEDEQLDSAIGETGADSEAVDEKLWNKNEDEDPNNTNEKFETGSSVQDKDTANRELRAKDDCDGTADDPGELNPDNAENQNDENDGQEGLGDVDNMDDMNMMDKDEAFADATELELDEQNQGSEEDMEVDEKESADPTEEECSDDAGQMENGNYEEEETKPMDETLDEAKSEQVDGTSERDTAENDHEEIMDLDAKNDNVAEPGNTDFASDHVPSETSGAPPKREFQAADSRSVAPEAKWSNSSDISNDLAPIRGLPSSITPDMEILVTDSSEGGRLANDQPKAQLPQIESSSVQKTQPNPYRNVGDAVQEWKERVKVSVDLEGDEADVPDDMVDENADEYGFVSQFEKGTAQALGPATSDQINKDINGDKPDVDSLTPREEDLHETQIGKQNSEVHPSKSSTSVLKTKVEEQLQLLDLKISPEEESPEVDVCINVEPGSLSESLVAIKKSYMTEDIHQLSELSLSDNDLGKSQNHELTMSNDMKDNATTLWRKYELQTTRLSQELTEQLRLVMEPTLASKFQGDYKTGKRINMKKVIQFFASNFVDDKFWLKRTRPDKREYQVVIAVDDSRSMSESCCGNAAIKALVTVCRAMSQLEVGKMAVASYGKKGNIKLLHDFDQPFTGDAGVKMISSLTFKQENTIADEPVVDLLKYLNNMLNTAIGKAQLPSGQNPLKQLVLIIADGRFHEKEKLKRCVKEISSNGERLVAFLLLDSPQESIMDLMEASFEGGNIKFSKYLDSFPFPYYIVLKDMEALPRTLADLLRQWFELMQR